jgi:hypothetical protein
MSLNLSTLTHASTSASILSEAATKADFLDDVPILKNEANLGNRAKDAKQTTALNQPKALPLIDGKGYLYGNGVSNNYASVSDAASFDISGDLTLEVDVTIPEILPNHTHRLLSKYNTNTGNRSYQLALVNTSKLQFTISSNGSFQAENSKISTSTLTSQGIVDGQRLTIKTTWRQSDGRVQFFFKTSNGSFTQLGSDQTSDAGSIYNSNANVNIGATNEGQITNIFKGAFHSAKIYASINETNKVLDVDFTDSSVADGAASFTCSTGQTVTINKSGEDPATLVRFNRLRFSGADTCLGGLFASTISSGYMFVVFRVLGSGGETTGRVFTINSTGQATHVSTGFIVSAQNTGDIASYYGGWKIQHADKFDEALGNIMHQVKFMSNSQLSRFNGGDDTTRTDDMSAISAEQYTIAASTLGGSSSANIDILALSLFPSSITDEQATQVVSYYNSKFSLF